MAQDVLNFNEESFDRIIEVLSQLAPELREHLDGAAKKITALSNEWDDEDHRIFLEAFNGIRNELDEIDDATDQMIKETRRKLEIIQARRNIKM